MFPIPERHKAQSTDKATTGSGMGLMEYLQRIKASQRIHYIHRTDAYLGCFVAAEGSFGRWSGG